MTKDEVKALIPQGFVECSHMEYVVGRLGWRMNYDGPDRGSVFAIPAPKPEPRRVPCGEMVVAFDEHGYWMSGPAMVTDMIRDALGGRYAAVANTTWRLNFDTREWVEVLQ